MEKQNSIYQEINPSNDLELFIHSFFNHNNHSDKTEFKTIFPDSYFKIIILIKGGRIVNYFMTGIWSEQKELSTPAHASIFGCRFKILAPEYLLHTEVASIHNTVKQLDLSYLNAKNFDISDFNKTVKQWESELRKKIHPKEIPGQKIRLSQLLYKLNGNISALELSQQIFWTNRQINRYLNKYLGISLKTYLNIQKCYEAYLQIVGGRFFPEQGYFDQAHFIREIKKHTGETPRSLFKSKNDRFIQLRNIKQK